MGVKHSLGIVRKLTKAEAASYRKHRPHSLNELHVWENGGFDGERECVARRDGAGAYLRRPQPHRSLPFQIDEFLKNLIRRGDDTGIGLESPLCRNHLDKALAEIDVGQFQRIRQHPTQSGAVRRTGHRLS